MTDANFPTTDIFRKEDLEQIAGGLTTAREYGKRDALETLAALEEAILFVSNCTSSFFQSSFFQPISPPIVPPVDI